MDLRTFRFLLLILLPVAAGCAGSTVFTQYPRKVAPWLAGLNEGKPVDAGRALRSEARSRDGLLYRLERGRIAHIQGDFDASRREFEKADAAMREGDERAVVSARDAGGEAAAWLLNDNARRYDPDGYERIFLRHYTALDYLFACDFEGAAVEARRANLEQEAARTRHDAELAKVDEAAGEHKVGAGQVRRMSDRFAVMDEAASQVANSFQNAYTFYLSGLLYEAAGEENDAYIDYRKALAIVPNNRYLQLDALRLAEKLGMQDDFDELRTRFRIPEGATFSKREPDTGEVVLFFEDGFVPPKEEVKFPVPLPGGGFGAVAFPIYRAGWVAPTPLHLSRRNVLTVSTEPVAYVDAMAVRALKEKIPGLVVRHLIRTGGKSAAAAAALKSDRNAGAVAGLAVGIWNVLSENADLRSWLSLPRDVQALRTRLPAGREPMTIRVGDGPPEQVDIEVRKGGITLVQVVRTGGTTRIRQVVLGGEKPADAGMQAE